MQMVKWSGGQHTHSAEINRHCERSINDCYKILIALSLNRND